MEKPKPERDMTAEGGPHFTLPAESAAIAAWEEIEPGRYMPRRVRGSYHGRALG